MYKSGILIICLAILLLGVFYFVPKMINHYKQLLPDKAAQTPSPSNPTQFATWKEFVPQSKLFKVILPQAPQSAKDLILIPGTDKKRRYEIYASEKIDGTLFLISVMTYPEDVDTSLPDEILHQTVEELIRTKPDNRLTKLTEVNFQKQHGLDFSMNNQEFYVEGRAIMVDKVVYVLSYITRKGDFDPGEYQYFVDSFELLNSDVSK